MHIDKRVSRRHFLRSSGAAGLAIGLGACGSGSGTGSDGGSSSPASGRTAGTLVIAASGMAGSFVPAGPYAGVAYEWTLLQMFETLMTFRDLRTLQPSLAKSYEVSEGGTRLTFDLRDDVSFQDGTKFDAEAVEFNYMRYLDKKHPFYDVNAVLVSEFLPGVNSVKALDEYRVQIDQETPTVSLINALACPFAGIMSPAAIRKAGVEDAGLQPVGTGQYAFVSAKGGEQVTLEAYDGYWGGPPPIKEVVIRSIAEPAALTASLLNGEVDLAQSVNYHDIPRFKDDDRFQVLEIQGDATGYMPFNVNGIEGQEAFADLNARRAACHAIDKQRLIKAIFNGYATPAGGINAPPFWSYDPSLVDDYPHDPAKARALLDESGKPRDVVLLTQAAGYWPDMAQLLQNDLNAVGFTVDIRQLDPSVYSQKTLEGRQSAMISDAAPNYPDPQNILTFFLGCDNPRAGRVGNWCSRSYDRLVAQQRVEDDRAERKELLWDMEGQIVEEAIVCNLYYQKFVTVASERVKDFKPLPLRQLFLDRTAVSA